MLRFYPGSRLGISLIASRRSTSLHCSQRCWYSRSGLGPEIFHFNKLLCGSDASCRRTTFLRNTSLRGRRGMGGVPRECPRGSERVLLERENGSPRTGESHVFQAQSGFWETWDDLSSSCKWIGSGSSRVSSFKGFPASRSDLILHFKQPKVDMGKLLGAQTDLEDFIFAHIKGIKKEVNV